MLVTPGRLLMRGSAAVPSLDLDFLRGTMPSGVTFTRASTGWYFNSAGVLTSAATNTPRLDYDPATLAAKGLLVEEARTNSLTNNSNTGAAAGTPGTLPTSWSAAATAAGITREIVGTGTVNGLPYIDLKFSGTAVAGDTVTFLSSTTGAATVNATTWTSSVYVALVAGALTNVTTKQGLRYRAAAGANITSQIYETSIVPTATLTRYTTTATGADATIAFILGSLNLTMASGAVDLTLRVAVPQLELGAFATSPVLCTSAAVTRAADVAVINPLGSWFNSAAGTLFCEFQRIGFATGGFPRSLSFSDGTNSNLIEMLYSSPNDQFAITTATVAQGPIVVANGGTALNKIAGAYATNDTAATINGAAVTVDGTATIPTVDRLHIGNRQDGARPLTGWVRRIKIFDRRLPNSTLQGITS